MLVHGCLGAPDKTSPRRHGRNHGSQAQQPLVISPWPVQPAATTGSGVHGRRGRDMGQAGAAATTAVRCPDFGGTDVRPSHFANSATGPAHLQQLQAYASETASLVMVKHAAAGPGHVRPLAALWTRQTATVRAAASARAAEPVEASQQTRGCPSRSRPCRPGLPHRRSCL